MKKLLLITTAILSLTSSSFACCIGNGEDIAEKLTLPHSMTSQVALFGEEIQSITDKMTVTEKMRFRKDYIISMQHFEYSLVPHYQENARKIEQQFDFLFPKDEISKRRREKQSLDMITYLRKRNHDEFITTYKEKGSK